MGTGAAPYRPDRDDRGEGGYGCHADVRGDHAWSAAGPGDGRGYASSGRGGAVWFSVSANGRNCGTSADRYWRSEHCPADSRPGRWAAGSASDGPAMAPMELGVFGPVVTSVPGQPDVAYDWWMSATWTPPTPVMATELRDSLTSGQVVALFGYDPSINWTAVGPREVTATLVKYARIGLAGVVPPCLKSPCTYAKRFHAVLRRVLRQAGRPVYVWEYRSHAEELRSAAICAALVPIVLGSLLSPHTAAGSLLGSPRVAAARRRAAAPCPPVRVSRPSDDPANQTKNQKPHPPPRRARPPLRHEM